LRINFLIDKDFMMNYNESASTPKFTTCDPNITQLPSKFANLCCEIVSKIKLNLSWLSYQIIPSINILVNNQSFLCKFFFYLLFDLCNFVIIDNYIWWCVSSRNFLYSVCVYFMCLISDLANSSKYFLFLLICFNTKDVRFIVA
jgi:hypothetical protein